MELKDISILIVDDDPKDLAWVEQSLLPLGARLQTLGDPQDVLRQVESARPDLVVLDALLPGISGFDLCKQIKTDSAGEDTLVVIITGVYLKDQYRRDAIQLFKADGFVTKPCRPVELQRVVLALLAKKLKTTPPELSEGVGHPGEEAAIPSPSEEPGWLARFWKTLRTRASRLARSPEPVPAPAEPDTSPGEPEKDTSPRQLEEEDAEARAPAEEAEEEDEEDDGEHEEGESTVRLLPTDSRRDDLPALVEEEPAPLEARRVEEAPRPQAIHKGVPIYQEQDFLFELRREVGKCERLGRPLTLILIRVMDLEQIVELAGGDFRRQVLWHVAEQALETLREVDLAGQLTSQELVGLIAFASGRYGGRRIVSRVKRAVSRHPFEVGEGLPAIVPVLRFGIAAFPKEAEDIDSLMDQARRELAS
jgi:CheY-like chemotaxis protein/GGDEF domain-containing protein